jgi:hypothetical protein
MVELLSHTDARRRVTVSIAVNTGDQALEVRAK